MVEEKKEEMKEAPVAKAPVAEAPASAPAETAEVKAETKEKVPAAVVKAPRGKGARPKQCTQCSKNLKKKTWYYRDNKYYCNKNCWKASKTPKAVAA